MIYISRRAESLLKEILDHRDEKGNCEPEHWRARFESLSAPEDALLRSLFKELREAEMITISWADNYPFRIYVLGKGLSYFEEKQTTKKDSDSVIYNNIINGDAKVIQIQQGTLNSSQKQSNKEQLDDKIIKELIETIKKYDAVLDCEYGEENANKLRQAAKSLEVEVTNHPSTENIRGVLNYIRDLSVNTGGCLIAGGILQLITKMVG